MIYIYIYYTYINKIRTSRQSPHTHWNPPACRTVLRSFFRIRSSVPRADQARSHSRLTQRWWWCLITGDFKIFRRIPIWLVNSTPLKYINQLGWLFPIYGKIKNVPNHQPDICLSTPPRRHRTTERSPDRRAPFQKNYLQSFVWGDAK